MHKSYGAYNMGAHHASVFDMQSSPVGMLDSVTKILC